MMVLVLGLRGSEPEAMSMCVPSKRRQEEEEEEEKEEEEVEVLGRERAGMLGRHSETLLSRFHM
jgi:hypothetical protein